MIECIQGEGGVNPLTAEFIQGVDAICHENDIVFMVDEVQTGNGRTGKLYAYMNFGVNPDVVTTAKGIGGGLPLGACLMGEKVEHVLGHGDHGSTFGGNPVACAGAVSIIQRLDDAFLAEVQRKGKILFGALEGAPGIENLTGMGMMCGIKPVKPAGDVIKRCIEKGVLCLSAKDKIRLLPALNMPEEVLVKAVNIIKEACAE
jgi:acetylornithine/N-succinyldiaminopimelate aminotransferase